MTLSGRSLCRLVLSARDCRAPVKLAAAPSAWQEAQAPSEAIPAPSTAESSPPAMRPPEPYSLRARGTPQRQLMVQSPASVPSARFLRSQAQSPKPSPLAGSTNAGAGSSSARMEE